jgi:hypothetical protein
MHFSSTSLKKDRTNNGDNIDSEENIDSKDNIDNLDQRGQSEFEIADCKKEKSSCLSGRFLEQSLSFYLLN